MQSISRGKHILESSPIRKLQLASDAANAAGRHGPWKTPASTCGHPTNLSGVRVDRAGNKEFIDAQGNRVWL